MLEKIDKIRKGGPKKLLVISDFDGTLTRRYVKTQDGRELYVPSVAGLIGMQRVLPREYSRESHELYEKYSPIEEDEKLDFEYRSEKMKEWWTEHLNLLIKYKLNKEKIEKIVDGFPNILRDGAKEFFNILKEKNVPLIVFSAGFGDFIEYYLEKEVPDNNIIILSNMFKYDKNGYVTGFKGDLIHSLNKTIKKEKLENLAPRRNNIILLGNTISDSKIVEDFETIIKIGFLGDPKKMERYKENFDVVIQDEPKKPASMEYVNELLLNI